MVGAVAWIGSAISVSLLLQSPHAVGADASLAPFTKLAGIPGGSIGHIAFDPNDPATMFVGGNGGGTIFKSTDGGANFTQTNVGGVFEAFRAIAVDPENSQIVFAASTDDANSGLNGGVYESQNGGKTWARLPHQPVGAAKAGNGRGMFIDTTGKIVVLSDKHQGLFYSANLGSTWSNPLPISKAHAYALANDPDHPATLWAGGYDVTNNFAGVLWKSTDTGKSWKTVTVSALDQTQNPLPQAIAILPGSGKILVSWYAVDPDTGIPIGGIVASSDGGTTWTKSSTGLPSDFVPGIALAVDTRTPTTVYATTNGNVYPNGLFRSTDSGKDWVSIGSKIDGADGMFTAAARPAKGTTPAAVFVGGDLLSSTDQGNTWTRVGSGIAQNPTLQVRDDLLQTGGLYTATPGGLFHSTDSGKSWTRISSWAGATIPRAIEVDPVSATHYLYATTQTTFWRSADAGKQWKSFALPQPTGPIDFLLADPTVAGRLYAADSANHVFRSTDYGQTWSKSSVGISGDVFTGSPASLVSDPTSSNIIYATLTSGLYRSSNAGASWTRTELPADPGNVLSIAPLAGKPNSLFADAGYTPPGGNFSFSLQKSNNNGAAWSTLASPFAAAGSNSAFDIFNLTAPPKATALFAYGFGSQVVRSATGANGSWKLIDAQLAPYFETGAVAYASGAKLYVWDNYGTGNAFSAPLASFTSGNVAGRERVVRAAR